MLEIEEGTIALDLFLPCSQNSEISAFQIWEEFSVDGLTGAEGDYLILCEDGSMYPIARGLFEKVFR